MHIVILDAHIFRVERHLWDQFNSCGTVAVYDKTTTDQVVDQCAHADIVCSCSIIYDSSLLSRLQHIELLCLLSSGYDKVDLRAAQSYDIAVCAIPDYSTIAVAEYLFALMLHHFRAVAQHSQAVSSGRWYASRSVSYWETEHQELYGKQLGIIGYGNIGRAVHIRAEAFGMKCVIYTRRPPTINNPNNDLRQYASKPAYDTPIDSMSNVNRHRAVDQTNDNLAVDLHTLLATSDIVSLHVPLTDETRHIIGEEELALMKTSAILLNVARGGLIDEMALYNTLKNNAIRAAVLDVTQQEPLPTTHPLLSLDNCTITPHIAWATDAARTRLLAEAVKAIQSFKNKDNSYRVI